MITISTIDSCRRAVRDAQREGLRVGLVPTMGALHRGHLSLVKAARLQCPFVVVTIFVNPTQFGPNEDFQAYPRTMDADLALCKSAGVSAVFAPTVQEMYPAGTVTTVRVGGLTDGLCGPFRPGHFDGVATVVAKLLHAAPADAAYFGEKDYQQLMVIRQMVRDLNFPIEIVACPTVREPDGLAMSSRNAYLSPADRSTALSISRTLFTARDAAAAGKKNGPELVEAARRSLCDAGISSIDYVEIVDAVNLKQLSNIDRPARMCIALRVGKTRLIDNVALICPDGSAAD